MLNHRFRLPMLIGLIDAFANIVAIVLKGLVGQCLDSQAQFQTRADEVFARALKQPLCFGQVALGHLSKEDQTRLHRLPFWWS